MVNTRRRSCAAIFPVLIAYPARRSRNASLLLAQATRSMAQLIGEQTHAFSLMIAVSPCPRIASIISLSSAQTAGLCPTRVRPIFIQIARSKHGDAEARPSAAASRSKARGTLPPLTGALRRCLRLKLKCAAGHCLRPGSGKTWRCRSGFEDRALKRGLCASPKKSPPNDKLFHEK
jgi:hypothetical protein